MPREWTLETPVLRAPGVVWRALEREVAIVSPEANAVRTLNEVGARCWELADGRTLGAIVEVLLEELEVSRDALEADLRAFLRELDERGLLAGSGG